MQIIINNKKICKKKIQEKVQITKNTIIIATKEPHKMYK